MELASKKSGMGEKNMIEKVKIHALHVACSIYCTSSVEED